MKVKVLIMFALLVGLFAGGIVLSSTEAGPTGFDDIIAIDGTFSDDLTVGGDMLVSGGIQFTGDQVQIDNDLDVLGDIDGRNIVNMRKPVAETTSITVTNNMTLTVAYGSYRLNAAGAVALDLNACTVDGQLVTFFGEDAQTVTIADSDIRTSDGSTVAVGQYDIATFQCFKGEWILISKLANS